MPLRVGIGYDVHRLVKERSLILGGVNIPYEQGLLGHSDGGLGVTGVYRQITVEEVRKGLERGVAAMLAAGGGDGQVVRFPGAAVAS